MKLYETLQQNLGKPQAEALLMFVENHLHEKDIKNERIFASKEAMKDLRLELKQEIAETRLDLKQDIAQTNVKIAETKTDIIRWLFAFFVPLLMAIIGLYVKK